MNEEVKKKKLANERRTGPHRVRMDGWIACSPFERLLNIQIVEAVDGKSVLKMPFYYDYAQGNGFMHGGALVGLADTSIVMAIKSLVPPGTLLFTESLEVRFLHAVKNGTVTANAAIIAQEGSKLFGKATLYNSGMTPVLEVKAVFKVNTDKKIVKT